MASLASNGFVAKPITAHDNELQVVIPISYAQGFPRVIVIFHPAVRCALERASTAIWSDPLFSSYTHFTFHLRDLYNSAKLQKLRSWYAGIYDELVYENTHVNVKDSKTLKEMIHTLYNIPNGYRACISFDSEGVGRSSTPTLLQIRDNYHEIVYLVDTLHLKEWAFNTPGLSQEELTDRRLLRDAGKDTRKYTDGTLRDIFEDPAIEKLAHDARSDSDCLILKFNVYPTGVIDTQLMHYTISGGIQDRRRIKLGELVEKRIPTTPELEDELSTKDAFDYSSFHERPLTAMSKQYAVFDVKYLYQLYHIMNKRMCEGRWHLVRKYSDKEVSEQGVMYASSDPEIDWSMYVELNTLQREEDRKAAANWSSDDPWGEKEWAAALESKINDDSFWCSTGVVEEEDCGSVLENEEDDEYADPEDSEEDLYSEPENDEGDDGLTEDVGEGYNTPDDEEVSSW